MRRIMLALIMVLGIAAPGQTADATVGQIVETLIRVQVAGEVKHPGLYTLPHHSRVADAIQLAGGLKQGATFDGLNLSARLQDGQAVLVSKRTPTPKVLPTENPRPKRKRRMGRTTSSAPVRLNSASLEELDRLPGIGPGLARDILTYRQSHGGFRSVEELREVQGIGEKRFQRLSPLLHL